MGRRPDDPEMQAAKGNPGKRPATTAYRLKQARALAKLLSKPSTDGDELSPPEVLNRKGSEPALAIWRDTAPKLRDFAIYDGRFDRHAFAQYCVWTALFYTSLESIKQHGETILTPMTNGGEMLRINPAFKIMDHAYSRSIELAAKFGMTPLDRARLVPMMPKAWEKRPDMAPAAVTPDMFAVPDTPRNSPRGYPPEGGPVIPETDDVGVLGSFRGDTLQ